MLTRSLPVFNTSSGYRYQKSGFFVPALPVYMKSIAAFSAAYLTSSAVLIKKISVITVLAGA